MKLYMSKKRLILIIILALLIGGLAYFSYYVSDISHADDTSLTALSSNGSYTVMDTSN